MSIMGLRARCCDRLETRGILLAGMILVFLLSACGSDFDDDFEGDMENFTWGDQVVAGRCDMRANANGVEVCVDRFEGRFIWTDYAAPWCKPCIQQAPQITRVERKFPDEVVFMTVITSEKSGELKVPSIQSAAKWARRFRFDPDRVVVGSSHWGMTIPTHILYSPNGQTLYRSIGYLPASAIREILEERMADWREYEENGKRARWMR